jgi:hypothetical protein
MRDSKALGLEAKSPIIVHPDRAGINYRNHRIAGTEHVLLTKEQSFIQERRSMDSYFRAK